MGRGLGVGDWGLGKKSKEQRRPSGNGIKPCF